MATVPFELPDNECIRMTRDEMSATRMVLIMASELNYAKEDLKKRLEIIPDGTERMETLAGSCTQLFRDILGTISDKQRRTLRNSAQDYDVKIVPKMSVDACCIAVNKDDMKSLVDCARERCKFCTRDGIEARSCELYQFLESYIPLNEYGSDLICPYNYEEWADSSDGK